MNKEEAINVFHAYRCAKANCSRSYAGSLWSEAGQDVHSANEAEFEEAEAAWLQIRDKIDAFVKASYGVGSNPLPHLRQILGGDWVYNPCDDDSVNCEFGSYGNRVGWILPR